MNRKKLVLIISAVLVVIAVITVSLVFAFKAQKNKTIDDDIVGKTVSLSEGLKYCSTKEELKIDDDFSKAYSSATSMRITSINEESLTATVEISAPPIEKIMRECIPQDFSGNDEVDLKNYMSEVIDKIEKTPSESKITSVVECKMVDEDGLKIMINDDFVSAVYPNLNSLIGEVLLDSFA